MSHTQTTKILLDLKDKNILIEENLTEKKQYRTQLTNVINGK